MRYGRAKAVPAAAGVWRALCCLGASALLGGCRSSSHFSINILPEVLGSDPPRAGGLCFNLKATPNRPSYATPTPDSARRELALDLHRARRELDSLSLRFKKNVEVYDELRQAPSTVETQLQGSLILAELVMARADDAHSRARAACERANLALSQGDQFAARFELARVELESHDFEAELDVVPTLLTP